MQENGPCEKISVNSATVIKNGVGCEAIAAVKALNRIGSVDHLSDLC